ncbi:hypothetical protein HDU82_007629 [Entophlyctis luteolus]|nr:hypothetical protein HDU82_007629 [Entophlyctis luteolus]
MTELSRHENAYVRPSPARGTLGGVALSADKLLVAAGYDIVLVETVGVGQSETMVADMVDIFTLIVAPGAGDELQGMKKGIVELSDLILVNKSDGILETPARMAQMEYTSALKFFQPSKGTWRPTVLRVSSVNVDGIDKAWDVMCQFRTTLKAAGEFEAIRAQQRRKWMWNILEHELMDRVHADPHVAKISDGLEKEVMNGNITSGMAAEQLMNAFMK